jgi:hypothetical protein
MSTGTALITGTLVSLAVTAVWSFTAVATIGPAPSLHMTRNLPSDYAQLAAAATGNGLALSAVVAVIFTVCLFVSGWRRRFR